ncbi:hypothetical protein B0H11DRAFT_1921209 [Mycena galericulata]|nr:hypothetical protein B0H11DRAFT_1921209 [Mycena galericulata]
MEMNELAIDDILGNRRIDLLTNLVPINLFALQRLAPPSARAARWWPAAGVFLSDPRLNLVRFESTACADSVGGTVRASREWFSISAPRPGSTSVRAYREWLQIPFAPREWLSRSAPEARSTWNPLPAPDSVGVYGIRCLYLFFFIRPPTISKHRRRLEHPTWQTPPARAAMGGLPPTVLTTISDLGDYPYQVKNNSSHSHALPINADMWQELSHPWTLAPELDTDLHVNYEFKVGQQPGPASFDEAVDLTLLTMAASMVRYHSATHLKKDRPATFTTAAFQAQLREMLSRFDLLMRAQYEFKNYADSSKPLHGPGMNDRIEPADFASLPLVNRFEQMLNSKGDSPLLLLWNKHTCHSHCLKLVHVP